MKALIKNQDKNNGKLCDAKKKKKLEQLSIINETKISKCKSKRR